MKCCRWGQKRLEISLNPNCDGKEVFTDDLEVCCINDDTLDCAADKTCLNNEPCEEHIFFITLKLYVYIELPIQMYNFSVFTNAELIATRRNCANDIVSGGSGVNHLNALMTSTATGFCNTHLGILEKDPGLDYVMSFEFMSLDNPQVCANGKLSGMGAMFNRQDQLNYDAVFLG